MRAASAAVEVITSLDHARAIEWDWRALARRARGITPFQRPEWLLPWYAEWAPDRINVLAARSPAGELVALFPCVMQNGRLELAGGGVSDYLAPLLDESIGARAAPDVDAALAVAGVPVSFNDLPRDSPWVHLAEQAGWSVRDGSACPVVSLAPEPHAWRGRLPAGLRRNLRRYQRQLTDDVGARFVSVTDPADVVRAIDALVALHGMRWQARELPGVLGHDDVRRFHRASAPAMLAAGALQLHLLVARDDSVIGAQYVLVRPPCAYSYIGGFDPDLAAYSPGTLLMAYSIDAAAAAGCTDFDLLRGREPYKYTWGAVDRFSVSLNRRPGDPS
jgi:CelD/BcsL family acetyltransferase involved in cellulose biosynthesis